MIRIGIVKITYLETMETAVNQFMAKKHISDDDVINLVPDRDNPTRELHIYYKEKDL